MHPRLVQHSTIFSVAAMLCLLAAPSLPCQIAPHPVFKKVESLVLEGDTIEAIRLLETSARREPRRAELWHKLGMLAWSAAGTSQRSAMRGGIRRIRYVQKADHALRLAARIAPDSGRYALDLGRFFLFNGIITVRLQATGHFNRAYDVARADDDSLLLSDVSDELGMVYWRRYQAVADRRPLKGEVALVPFDLFMQEPRTIATFLETKTIVLPEPAGAYDYHQATALFQQAVAAHAGNARAVRHALMALVERGRWTELRTVAMQRLEMAPWDPWSWLSLGLAAWRLDDATAATTAFDSALVMLAPGDWAFFTELSRILPPADSVQYAGLDARSRHVMDRIYWTAADPLELTEHNELRLEYLARVAESELRWSSEDFALRGASTDRGQILIRFGPPPVVASFAPHGVAADNCPGFRVDFEDSGEGRPNLDSCRNGNDPASGLILWYYPDDGLHFVFRAPPSFGVALFTQDYAEHARESRAIAPVRWPNVRVMEHIDSLPVLVTRFRADGDSSDVLFDANLSLQSLTRGDLARTDVLAGVVIRDRVLRKLAHDTVLISISPADSIQALSWVRRLAPGELSYRVEALARASQRAARASGTLSAALAAGFGLSDIAVVRSAVARPGTMPERWNDLDLVPSAGAVRRGQPFAVVWETYDLAADAAQARYSVDLTIRLRERSPDRPIVARVIEGVEAAIGIRQRDDNTVSISYTRAVAARSAVVDYLTLELPEAEPGTYTLSIAVTDLIASRTMMTERIITVR